MFRRVKGGAVCCFFVVEDDYLGGFLLRECWVEEMPVVVI